MQELSAPDVTIADSFWSPRLDLNAARAIFHQWQELEATGCIDNFRIAAGEKDGFREGYFFADSDAYKWLDAASRISATYPTPKLAALMDAFILLLGRAQMPDGYLFTYNQIHFPGRRWVNLQIEHELYCHGHLIEAGVSHSLATGRTDLLDLCVKAADLIVQEFLDASNAKTCGHEEIELALVRLHRLTSRQDYLDLAQQFVERRGRIRFFPLHFLRQLNSSKERRTVVDERRKAYIGLHPEHASFHLPGDNAAKKPRFSRARWYLEALSGRYSQQHAPVRRQAVPVGHSVRFGYLETAVAMLGRERRKSDSQSDLRLHTLEQAWERMVARRMYITGGLGAVPGLEGFGGDYELDPGYAYAETCASIASLFWNWEMALLTEDARYSDLFEWQLHNAANVGMGHTGDTYLYNNPLEVHGGVTRKAWYSVPCCPSNLSRTFADLGKYIYSFDENHLWLHQYISSEATVHVGVPVNVKIESQLPWGGKVQVHVQPRKTHEFTLHLRKPSWDTVFTGTQRTACGYDPRAAKEKVISRTWPAAGDRLQLDFDMSIKLRRAHPRVQGHAGKAALTRGPLVYCLESIDNPDLDIFSARLDIDSLWHAFEPELLGGCVVLHGKTTDGKALQFIPYFLWGNRGESQMTVWVLTT